jgi:hypothetical protein
MELSPSFELPPPHIKWSIIPLSSCLGAPSFHIWICSIISGTRTFINGTRYIGTARISKLMKVLDASLLPLDASLLIGSFSSPEPQLSLQIYRDSKNQ